MAGPGVRIIDDDVIDTADPGEGFAVDAINVAGANGAVIEGNRIANQFLPVRVFGITIFDSSGVLVVNNRIVNLPDGVTYLDATGKYRDNLAFGVASPFDGGTDAGNNNWLGARPAPGNLPSVRPHDMITAGRQGRGTPGPES